MGALAKLCSSFSNKILAVYLLKVLPEVLRLIVLSVCVLRKHCRNLNSKYKFMSMINKKSSKFAYGSRRAHNEPGYAEYCSICLSGFVQGDECRELVCCKHGFHRGCLETWLVQGYGSTCPLCRSLVVPEVIAAEYHRVQNELENDLIEKELARVLLNALHAGSSCNGYF